MQPEKTRPLIVGPETDALCCGEDAVSVSRVRYCRDLCVTGPVLVVLRVALLVVSY